MDCSTYKLYHKDGFDSKQHLEEYLSDKIEPCFEEDFLTFPIESLAKTFSMGHIKGDILIDLSAGSMVHQLYAACEFFKCIIVLKVRNRCIMELKRWLDTRTGAFHWGHATQLHLDLEGNSDQLQEKEEKMRSAIQHVVKCDLEKENMTEPMNLPPADCIVSVWLLDIISKDKDDYRRYLKKFSSLLKPGGHLILLGVFDTTYITIRKEKIHILSYDEDFVRNALAGEGFLIDSFEVKWRTDLNDLIDHKATIFVAAHKKL